MTSRSVLAAVLALAISVTASVTASLAADAHFGQTAFSTETGTTAQDTFAPDTPKILLHVQLFDAKKGQKVTAAWIAEKTAVAPPNFKIDSATVSLQADNADEVTFSLTRPNRGWPAGTYRVDLDIDGGAKISPHFSVAQ